MIVSLISNSVSFAEAGHTISSVPTLQALSAQHGPTHIPMHGLKLAEIQKQIGRAASEHPKAALGSVGHTILFLMVMAGIDLTIQQVKREGLTQTTIHPEHLFAIAYETSGKILDNGAVWSGILGAGVASLSEKPALAISSVFSQPGLKSAFRGVMARAIVSTLSFIGWEFGSELWNESVQMLPTEADEKTASSVGHLAASLFLTAAQPSFKNTSAADSERVRVSKMILKNMTMIVLFDSKLRNQWIDKTWRLHILTGEFSTLLGAMIASGAIGTALCPGAGTLVGIIFGVAGGLSAMLIPPGIKDGITLQFDGARLETVKFQLEGNQERLFHAVFPQPLVRFPTDNERIRSFNVGLRKRHQLQDAFIQIVFEEVYLTIRALHLHQVSSDLAHEKCGKAFSQLNLLFNDENSTFTSLANLYHSTGAPLNILEQISAEELRLSAIKTFIQSYAQDLHNSLSNSTSAANSEANETQKLIYDFLESTRNDGFKSDDVVMAVNQEQTR